MMGICLHGRQPVWAVVIGALILADVRALAQSFVEIRPAWEELPPPSVLYLAQSPDQEQWAERLRHCVPADVTFAPLALGDLEFHHLCDKPLEETREEREAVVGKARRHVEELVGDLDRFQLVIAQFPPKEHTELQRRLVEWVRGGGRLIFVNPGWETTFEESPLAEIMPVRSGRHKAWAAGCGPATDHPLVRGLPLEVLGTHWYGPIYEAVGEWCSALTQPPTTRQGRMQNAAFWHGRLPEGGEVVHLFAASGGKHAWLHGTDYATYAADRPDDSAVWNALYRRLIYGLVYGRRAFPVLADISVRGDAPGARHGEPLPLEIELENRSAQDTRMKVFVEISHRRATREITALQSAAVAQGKRQVIRLAPVVDLPCTDSSILVRAVVLDGQGRRKWGEGTAWLPYRHATPLVVRTDRPSYAPGQRISATVLSDGSPPDACLVTLYLVDHAGRALDRREGRRADSVQPDPSAAWSAQFVMPDGGPKQVGCYWLVAVARRGQAINGMATAQVQLDQPWDMRAAFQWSVWSHGAEARKMGLYHDAGFNALGMVGNSADADRYAMRQYVEGTGIDTFSVTIDHDNWADVRQAMVQRIEQLNRRSPDARNKSLVSLGEESGFQGGWGTRYYWPEDKAPPLVQKVFGQYLSNRYGGNLAELNRQWGADYASFDEIPLEKAKVRQPGRLFVTSQAWEAMQKRGETKNVVPVDLSRVDPEQDFLAHSAPFVETFHFFDWYYQRYCDLATEVYRTQRNPVPRTIMSAPGGFYPKVDVYNFAGQGPFYPKEAGLVGNAIARRDYGDVPGFSGAMWAYFDLRSLWKCTVLSSILVGNSHIDYWVDIPLTFNADLTHTRASFWTKVLRQQLRPIEAVLTHKRFAYTQGLGMYIPDQPLPKGLLGAHFHSSLDGNASLYSALEESGYMPRVVPADNLQGIRVLLASYAQVVSDEDARCLTEFVARGGTLVATPWIGACSRHGNFRTVYPALSSPLVGLLGFRLLNTSQAIAKEAVKVDLTEHLPLTGPLHLVSKGRDKVLNPAADVQVLARYEDGVPLVLSRKHGQGKVVYLNLIYDWDAWWNSFYEPPREAYRKLIRAIVESDGRIQPEYTIAFHSAKPSDANKGWTQVKMTAQPEPGEAVPWWASQLYRDPSGKIKYLAVFSDHRSPTVNAELHWRDSDAVIFDLLRGTRVNAKGKVPLSLPPGGAAFLAIARHVPAKITLDAPREVTAGQTLKFRVGLPEEVPPEIVYGAQVDVYGPDGEVSPDHSLRNVQLAGRTVDLEIPTALNDRSGRYRLVVTESMTRVQASAELLLSPSHGCPEAAVLTPFPPRPGETWPRSKMSSERFLALLCRLREVYMGDYQGLEAKYALSYYLNVPFRPEGRHALVRQLQRTDWQPHLAQVAEAVRAGERFYLVGEDLNRDPPSEVPIDPLAVAAIPAFLDRLASLPDARRRTVEVEGLPFDVITIGKGAMIVTSASVDRAAYHSSDFATWHARLKKALAVVRP